MTVLPPSSSWLDFEVADDDFAFFRSLLSSPFTDHNQIEIIPAAAPAAKRQCSDDREFLFSQIENHTLSNDREHNFLAMGKRQLSDDQEFLFSDRRTIEIEKHSLSYDQEVKFSASPVQMGKRRRDDNDQLSSTSSDKRSPSPPAASASGRRLWVKDRSREWWDRLNSPDCPEADFRRAFRMSKATFDYLCDELAPAVAKEDTTLRAAIPVRHRVAVAVYRLATGEPLRMVSKRFGLGISTCHKLVLEVCSAIKTVLMPKALAWPNAAEAADNAARFEAVSGLPGVVGAMYTTHVPIIAPKVNVASYFNRRHTELVQKTSYSITVQGVVGPDGVFTDVCIGWPGSMPDEQILEKSVLYQRAANGHLKNQWVVGGASFPLMDWVLVPYSQKNLTWGQHAFNEKIGAVRGVAKAAFERMKSRWGCLQRRTEVKLQDLPIVLGACCVLHNICEMRKEVLEPEQEFELVDDEMVAENPIRSASAMQARDAIAHNLLHRGLGMNFL